MALAVSMIALRQPLVIASAKQPGGFTRAQTKLAQTNLLCLVSDLYMGSDDYQAESAQVVAAKAGAQAGVGKAGVVGLQARAATAVAHLGAREDGPNEDFVSLLAFKDYAMATFTVLISSAVVEGFFSQFAGMQDKTRNTLSDLTWSWSMWTRTAAPINEDVAHAFEHAPVLKDDARKGRLPWAFK